MENIAALLDHLGLTHLHETPDAPLTDGPLQPWLGLKRVLLLNELKAHGVGLAERQAIANGLAKATREGRVAGSQPAAAPAPAPAPNPSRASRTGPKGRILCIHGGGSSGEIMKVQLNRFILEMGKDYEFLFVDGPAVLPMDPNSPQARVLNHFFTGLPVLRWMTIVDKATGVDANIVGFNGGQTRVDKKTGETVNLLDKVDEFEQRERATFGLPAPPMAPAPSHSVTAAASMPATASLKATPSAPSDEPTRAQATSDASADVERPASAPPAKPSTAAPSTAEPPAAGPPTAQPASAGPSPSELSGERHAYAEAGVALRTLARFVRAHGPFDGFFGFSQVVASSDGV